MKAILTYHSVDGSGSPISIEPVAFRRHMEWLALHGPRIVSIEELLRLPKSESAAAITFDDAFVNFADLAWPVLRDHALPVTLYVPTDHAGGTNVWSAGDRTIPQLPLLGWDALGELAMQGVTLGSHTCTHPHLTRLDDERVRSELTLSTERIQTMLGVRPAGLAYPYGAHDRRIAAIAAKIYDHACTTELRVLGDVEERYKLPRLDAYYLRSEGGLESWGTPRIRLYLRARAGARRCRELLSFASHR